MEASIMMTTKQFIRRKCSKDHLRKSVLPRSKQVSVYGKDYKKTRTLEKSNSQPKTIIRELNASSKEKQMHVFPPSSAYQRYFQKDEETEKPVRQKEKPSFFLKMSNYDKLDSTYNRVMAPKPDIYNSGQRGKPQIDHILFDKCHKSISRSQYRDSFVDYTKLPSIYQKQKQNAIPVVRKKFSNYASFHQSMRNSRVI